MDCSAETDPYTIAREERQKHVDAVVQSQDSRKLVVAGPGTGKTYLFKTVLQGKAHTLTLTFVNALVEDLSLELFGLSEVKTLHGFARGQLARLTRKKVRVFPKLSEVIKEDAAVLLHETIDFDNLFHNRVDPDGRLGFYKTRRRYYDYYGFSDIIYAAVLCFEQNEEKIPCYAQVVVDEFQDFNALEVSLIELLATRSPVLLAGDDDQALYESLKSASPRHIRERYAGETGAFVRFNLPYCSRNTRVLVGAANDIIARAQENGLLLRRIAKDFRYFPCAEKDTISDANPHIIHSRVFAQQIVWFIQKQIMAITRDLREKYTVLVLSPTRRQCQTIYRALMAKGFQNVRFAEKIDLAEPALLDGMKLLLLDAHCNLGWRIAAKALLASPEFEALLRQTDGQPEVGKIENMVSPALKKQVQALLADLRGVRDGNDLVDNNVSELLRQIGVDAYGAAKESLREQLTEPNQPVVDPGIRGIPIEATTFQSAKGLAADYVFITHFDDRYCVRKSNAGMSDQDVCSFLVALTRAKRRAYLLSTHSAETPTFLSWIDGGRIREVQSPRAGSV